jgi:predicted dehydrogenase
MHTAPHSSSPKPPLRILLVGFGRIAQHHVAAIFNTPGLELVGAVDPSPTEIWNYRGSPLIVYPSLENAVLCVPDIVVILTPTGTHVSTAEQVLSLFPGVVVLIEKPFALPDEDTSKIFMLSNKAKSRYLTIYHMAYSPEVLWALKRVESQVYGSVTGFSSQFLDPYVQDPQRAITSLHSSWWDSGSNALSVLNRFFSFGHVNSLLKSKDSFSTYSAKLDGFVASSRRLARGGIFTSWDATAPAQSTRLTMDSGIEVVMNHTSLTSQIVRDGVVTDFFSGDPRVNRREAHYRNLYHELSYGGIKSVNITDTYSIQRVLMTKVTTE